MLLPIVSFVTRNWVMTSAFVQRYWVYAHNFHSFDRPETWVFYAYSDDTPANRLKVASLVNRLNAAGWTATKEPVWIGSAWGLEATGPNRVLGSMDGEFKPILDAIFAEAGLGSMLV